METNTKNIRFTFTGFFIWFLASLFFLYEFFLRTFLGALAKQIIPDLNLSASRFALLASVFYIAYGLMQIPVGLLADRFGVKKCMIFATALCALSAFLFSKAHHFGFALLCRFMMGFGGAFAFLCLLILTISWFPKKYLAFMVGLGQFVGTLGALIAGGPLASVVVSKGLSWRLVFSSIAVLGVVIFVFALVWVKEREAHAREYQIFIAQKMSLKKKLLQLFDSSQAMYIALYSSFVFLSLAMLGAVWGVLYIQSLGFSQTQAAYTASSGWLGFAIGCPLLGYLSDHWGRRKSVMALCSGLGLIVVILTLYVTTKMLWFYRVGFFLIGLTGAGQSVGFATITEHVVPALKSVALGLNSAFITLLASITPLIVGVIMDYQGKVLGTGSNYTLQEFRLPFAIMPLLYFLAALFSIFLIEETYCRSKKKITHINSPKRNK